MYWALTQEKMNLPILADKAPLVQKKEENQIAGQAECKCQIVARNERGFGEDEKRFL